MLMAIHLKPVEREEAEQRLRVSFDHAPIGMAIVAPDGRMLQVNPALCRITGFSDDELLSTTRQELTHPDDRLTNHQLATQLLSGDIDTFEMEKRYLHAEGHYVWIHLSVSLVRDKRNDPLYFVAQIQDIEARKRTEVELLHVAEHDSLTGLFNRRGFEPMLTSALAVARTAPGGALLVLDLDNFKYVNDNLGRESGDRIIESVATILRTCVRESDHAARFGGDEFAILLTEASADGATQVAQNLLQAIRSAPILASARAHRLTTSIGVSVLDGSHGTADQAISQADTAMYTAKEAGRNQVRVWGDGSSEQQAIVDRMTWAGRIEDAFRTDSFVMLAQPILDLRTGAANHYELLLRMRDSDGSLLPPAAFLQTAERFDLVQGIDRWVVNHATELLRRSEHQGCSLAVNLSGRSIGDQAILDLLKHDVPAQLARLTFEITETATIADLAVAAEFSRDLQRLGCRVALDDFGVGFGSFGYLKHLPFDSLKIDGDFVRECTASRTDRLIIEAIVGVAKGLGRETVAEFVEDAATVDYLRSVGVDRCQGYFISRPLAIERAFDFMADGTFFATSRSAERVPAG
jgi:diguanylate cyclase (GGDEF)-like protein/PAS domain S-box-containing protein